MSLSLIVTIVVGIFSGWVAYFIWSNMAIDRVQFDRYAMRCKIRSYLRTGAITMDIAAELTEKIYAVDVNKHAHYVRTFRDPRVLYPSELSW